MRRFSIATTLIVLSVLGTAHASDRSDQPKPLRLGLLPYISTRHLMEQYHPLKNYLETRLQRPVTVSTAPSFRVYIERARSGDYDLYHTAPHFAALAEHESGYRRVSRLARELDGTLVVRTDSNIETVEDLRGRVITAPDQLAIITMLGEALMQDHGMTAGSDYIIQYTPSHNNAVLAVARKKSDAAISSAAVFEKMPQTVRKKLRILTFTRKVPHMMFLANPALPEDEYQNIRRIMLEFTAGGAGKRFFQRTGYGDMSPITDANMQALEPFLLPLKLRINNH